MKVGRRRLGLTAVAVACLAMLTAALAAALNTETTAGDGSTATVMTPRPAPAMAGPLLGGGSFDPSAVGGRVAVVTIWASWCAPCREELPVLAAARTQYPAAEVAVLGVLTRDQPEAARALMAETGAGDLPSVLDPDGGLAVSWGATGVPETYLVDPGGVIRDRHIGPVTAAWLADHLTPLLDR